MGEVRPQKHLDRPWWAGTHGEGSGRGSFKAAFASEASTRMRDGLRSGRGPRPGRQPRPRHRPPTVSSPAEWLKGAGAGWVLPADTPRSLHAPHLPRSTLWGCAGTQTPSRTQPCGPSPPPGAGPLGLELGHRSDGGGSWGRTAGRRVLGSPGGRRSAAGGRSQGVRPGCEQAVGGVAASVPRGRRSRGPCGQTAMERVPRAKAECVSCAVGGSAPSGRPARVVRGLGSHGGQVHAVGRLAALVPGAELGGGCARPGPVHLQDAGG